MQCKVSAYEGPEPYVYLINSHQDDGVSFPLAERLAAKGLRVWHDAATRENQSAWKSKTSRMLNGSAAALVLLSQGFTQAHLCRRQFTDAIESGKPIVVLRLGNPALTLGMRLQTEACGVLDCSFPPPDSAVDALLRQDAFKACIGPSRHDIEPQAYARQAAETKPKPMQEKRQLLTEHSIIELSGGLPKTSREPAQTGEAEKQEPAEALKTWQGGADGGASQGETAQKADTLEQTIITGGGIKKQGQDGSELDETLLPKRMPLPVIVSLATGLAKKGLSGETVIGRQAKLQAGQLADIRFDEQSNLFSRRHFKLICVDSTCALICLHDNNLSLNGMMELLPNEPFRIEGSCVIEVPGKSVLEQYSNKENSAVRFAVAYEKDAQRLWDAPCVATMESLETGEIRAFWEFPIRIGRNHPWASGAMTTKTISAEHATISLEGDRLMYEDHSSNGTIINGDTLCNHEKRGLASGDVLRVNGKQEDSLRDEHFVFRFVKVERASD